MFEKEAKEYAENNAYKYANDIITCQEAYKDGAEFGYNKANEQLTLPKDILGLWEQTVCEIRSEIKAQDTPALVYAKKLCDKLEHSMCAVAGGPYSLRYSITD